MKIGHFLGVAVIAGLLTSQTFAAQIGVTEIAEGTVRTVYVDKPMVGARGYVVADWEAGDVQVEVIDFPASSWISIADLAAPGQLRCGFFCRLPSARQNGCEGY